MSFISPKIYIQLFTYVVKCFPKQLVFLRIILYSVNSCDKLAVSLFQSVQNNIIRNSFIMNINVRKHRIASHGCLAVYKRHLKIAVFPNRCSAAQNAVISCARILKHTAPHLSTPAEVAVFLNAAAHEPQYFRCGSEMNKLCRREAKQLQPVRAKHIPYLCARFKQFFAKLALWLFFIELLQR